MVTSLKPHLLVVEDNPDLCRFLDHSLSTEGYSVRITGDGRAALAAHQRQKADLIVLDLMLPLLDGFGVLMALRQAGDQVPVLMLTALGEEKDRVRGLALGADDYLVKPFSMLELLERVKAILRRTLLTAPQAILSGPFRLERGTMTVSRDATVIDLTAKEYRVLEALLTHASVTLSRQELLERAWDPDAWPTPRTVDSHIARLRRKLGDDDELGWILTVGGEGYRWTLPASRET